jgi:L-alanine-DL-glutamate epimerase-like enolase superfamily enzyme
VRLIDDDGTEGWGEAAPSRFYGESADSVVSSLRGFAPLLERADPWAIDTIELELDRALRFNAAAKVAVSAALHDLAGKRLGVPLYKMWGLDPARAPQSSFTIGIGDKAELKRKVKDAAEYPVLKVKLGTDRDAEIIRTVREAAPSALLRIDANAAWTARQALQMMDVLVECGVEFVEQPLPPHDIAGLRFVRERAPLPIIADESCLTNTDIPKLVGAVDGINIKLAKCASLREALRMVGTARAHGLRVMMGCMVESSLGIAAASHLAPLLDYADLDGAALLANDPFVGPSIAGGSIAIPTTPGLGVSRA